MREASFGLWTRMASGWIDVTRPIDSGMVVYEGDPPVQVVSALAIERGDPANVARLILGSHTGTHVDAPRHFIVGGATVDQLPLEPLMGPARVLECPPGPITSETVASARLGGAVRVILKTGNSALWERPVFVRTYQALTLEGARELVGAGITLVGIDYLSVEGFGTRDHPVHRCLLEAGVVILEGLDLSAVAAGAYELRCLPLSIRNGDGAPARAILRPL